MRFLEIGPGSCARNDGLTLHARVRARAKGEYRLELLRAANGEVASFFTGSLARSFPALQSTFPPPLFTQPFAPTVPTVRVAASAPTGDRRATIVTSGLPHDAVTLPLARCGPWPSVRSSPGGSSRFRGVLWDRSSNGWRAKIKVKGRTWYLGTYKDEVEAAEAYDAASFFCAGARAIVNFPNQSYELVELPRQPPEWLIEHLVLQASKGLIELSSSLRRWVNKNPDAVAGLPYKPV